MSVFVYVRRERKKSIRKHSARRMSFYLSQSINWTYELAIISIWIWIRHTCEILNKLVLYHLNIDEAIHWAKFDCLNVIEKATFRLVFVNIHEFVWFVYFAWKKNYPENDVNEMKTIVCHSSHSPSSLVIFSSLLHKKHNNFNIQNRTYDLKPFHLFTLPYDSFVHSFNAEHLNVQKCVFGISIWTNCVCLYIFPQMFGFKWAEKWRNRN